jgi:hypothetical protein
MRKTFHKTRLYPVTLLQWTNTVIVHTQQAHGAIKLDFLM